MLHISPLFSSLFAFLLLVANVNAIDFGNIMNKAKEEAEKKAKEEAAKKLKEEAEKALKEAAKKYTGDDPEEAKPAKPVATPIAKPPAAKPATASATVPAAVRLNPTVNLAVLETKIDADPAVVKEFKPSELRYITQEIRRQSVNNLPKPKFSVMVDSAQMQNDVVSLGEKMDADFIARGILGKFRKNYTFTVEVYDAGNGKLILSSDPIESEKAEDMLSGFRKTAPDFFKKLENELTRIEGELGGFRRAAPVAQPKPAPVAQPKPAPAAQPQPAPTAAQPLLPPATGTSPECQTSYNVFAACQ
jgi:hypothetical protein